ncbi:DUF6506 family protein [Nocardiopsis exhalans]|uniref:DUF6506 family protein n=1 Tax=Nocardiopsis exhalans TaxID=163604 RepID=A0ABY5DDH9_9ACTN|nr:DUF6506 family protein [Nocardiopsis exhalans]USY22381.1 DUF6506 family protein [Nocardiopsis exhalans]
MSASWAYLYLHPETDPDTDRTVLDRGGIRTTLVAVPSPDRAPEVAAALASEGATLIELCGGFSLEAAAAVRSALPSKVAVGHVTVSVDSVHAAAAFGDSVS